MRLWTLALLTSCAVAQHTSDSLPCKNLLRDETVRQLSARDDVRGAPRVNWNASLVIGISSFTPGWQMTLRFSRALDIFTNHLTGASSGDNRQFVLRAPEDTLPASSSLVLVFSATYSQVEPPVTLSTVHFNGRLICNDTGHTQEVDQALLVSVFGQPNLRQTSLRYDYKLALANSLLFYEAQRSGLLPLDNAIPWRNDSCLNDRGAQGEDLTGGYYTNGRTLKFTFPNAAATTVLAWGLISNEAGYQAAGQLELARDALNWGATYLARCHTRSHELYALVGDVNRETTEFWGRPEDLTYRRPAFAISRNTPGSEVAAEVAAALAASSVALKEHYQDGPELSALYLSKAKQLYDFAKNYRGDYSKAFPQITDYKSWSGDEDELVWAALWLFRATADQRYHDDALDMYNKFNLKQRRPTDFSWDEKTLGVRVLLSQMTLEPAHVEDARRFCDTADTDPKLRTPKGLFHTGRVVRDVVGSIRYASNVAFVCFQLGEVLRESTETATNPYLHFAIKQVNYILGETGRSFMVGFGTNPPLRPHHSASSCPSAPASCGWEQYNSPSPNPQILRGALVGGPDVNDNYTDSRSNWSQNDVGLDYNAGFQSLLAGLLTLHKENKLPTEAYK